MKPGSLTHSLSFVLSCSLAMGEQLAAETFVLPPTDVGLVGTVEYTDARPEETLLDIARRHDLGQEEILLANPDVDRWLPEPGARVLLPNTYILPDAPREGLVLNLPEMRLYYFGQKDQRGRPAVITHPVSVGRMDWKTPLGRARILRKAKDPSWRPPQSLHEEAAADGRTLPEVVPPGPDNPLGRYAMYLSISGYLIHSTNKPYGVGMRVTHGCVRMYPEDIEELFPLVPVNTPVQIVNQPIKLGWYADTLYIEVHPRLEEDQEEAPPLLRTALEQIYAVLEERPVELDSGALMVAVAERRGIPVAISQ